MTTLEMKLTLSERLAKKAQAAGLLNPKAIEKLLQEAVRRQALRQFLSVSRERAQGVGFELELHQLHKGCWPKGHLILLELHSR